jgi:putative transposase
MISICRDHASNVKRWRDGQMVLRWVAAGMGEAAKQFRRVDGHLQLPTLRAALDATVTPNRYTQPLQGGRRLITHRAATEVPRVSGHPR